ncbi:MAG: PAS domain S-box protein [Pseudomonadota bacterium]
MKDTTVNTDAETFQVAFKNAPIGMAIVDLDGRWLSVNQALCDIVGYTKEEFLSSDFRSITHPDDLDADLALLKQLYKNEIPSYEMEKRYFHKDGSIVWAHLTVGTVRDDNGTPKYYISQILDVSDRKIGEQSLKDQKNLLELAERTAHLGHWSYDLKTEELFWSDEVFRIHGLNKEEYTPEVESAIGFYHPDDREDVERMFNAAIEKQKPFNFDFRLIHQLGRVIYVQTSGRPEMNYKGEVVSVFGVFQDISERKAAEQSLLRANKELETFAYVASHDLRAPLRGVDNLAQWIEEDLQDKMSDEGRECMRLLRQRVSRLEMMLQDILSYSRVGRVEEDPEVFRFK